MADQTASTDSHYFYGLKPDKSVVVGHGKRTAENSCQYMLPTLLAKAKNNPDLQLLDVGCGPGSISTGLARYLPHGQVTAVDLSSSVLEQARALAAEQKVANISFEPANIYDLPFKDGTFDVVHTHQTVCHCREPVRAIRELIRVTRQGGIVCMRKADIHSVRFWPDAPLLQEAFRIVAS